MLEWLTANIGTILITAGLIVIVALIIRSIVRDKKAGISSCGALRDVKNLKPQNT